MIRLSDGPGYPDETFLTRSEVAHMLGVSPTTVTRWAREGKLPCQRTLGGHHRFERTVIEDVKEHMRQGALTSSARG